MLLIRCTVALGLAMLLPLSLRAADPVIAAASDLKFALDEIAGAFTVDTGHEVRLTYGSSGLMATQIRNGAPFQLYLSADEDYVLQLHADGYTRDQGTLYAAGRLALVVPHNSPLPVAGNLDGLGLALRAGQVRRFAIANPEHAPYGARAREALQHAGLWELALPRLVYGENVSQAAQFATGGSAEGGIIALSLALSPALAAVADYAVIPASYHAPLLQRMVLLQTAGATAEAFYAYLQQSAARAVMRRYGFTLPDEELQ
ncbi:molybdate ABC transporter substrate-binding protein [Haliea sp. E1-2-M8]|uniref:molybdate ABC transporter substrate-binding protein n=1 Tax=Haliea sp. E1-2-M8 TaxID=3064706 RepID=UPI0027248F19|nr:molybdate ABC transporter substrate-binding protein [Haliea sp. E1-2-M8]MDO8863399.1 molybdate ABC transporter substrate-binding protein [Haliea sp. E1-2-M8]